MIRVMLIGVLVCLGFWIIWNGFYDVYPPTDPSSSKERIVVIPLDDRPINTSVLSKMIGASGATAILPPVQWLGNRDTPGETDLFSTWLDETIQPGDTVILSMDMWLYGGLSASRDIDGASLDRFALSNRIDALRKLHQNHPDVSFYGFDTIQRLTPPVFVAEDLPAYHETKEWLVSLDDLDTLASYEIDDIKDPNYDVLQNRMIKQKLTKQTLALVEEGVFEVFFIVTDDAAECGIHQVEKRELQTLIETMDHRDRIRFLSGTDEIDGILASRAIQSQRNQSFSVYIDGVYDPSQVAPFESVTVEETILDHIIASGANISDSPNDADLILFVYGGNAPIEASARLKTWIDQQKRVALIDIHYVNKADEAFVHHLNKDDILPHLFSFSAWNTASNAIGIGLSQAILRLSYLEFPAISSNEVDLQTAEHYTEVLATRYAKDYLYKAVLYPEINAFAESHSYDPYFFTQEQNKKTEAFLLARLDEEIDKLPSFFVESKKEQQLVTVSSFEDVTLPWNRLFEATLDLRTTQQTIR